MEERDVEIEEFIGKTFTDISVNNADDEIIFTTNKGKKYKMYHYRDCCECVDIEDIEGDLKDLVGSPILQAEEVANHDNPKDSDDYNFTWTFYKLSTIKGYVTIRWYGESNGYYSEKVDIIEISD